MDKIQNEYFCILGGGGIRGCSYIGSLQALKELNIKIAGWAGSSIGSIVAVLCALGYTIEELNEIFLRVNTEFFKDLNFSLGKDFALSKGGFFLEWIKDKIESRFYKKQYIKGKMPPVTFKDLKQELIIFSVNLYDSTFHEFSKAKTPDEEIANAVRASVSMPGLYKPVMNGKDCLVDGDLIKSTPLWRVSPTIRNSSYRILEFRLEDNEEKREIKNTLEYLNAVYNTVSGFATDYIIDMYKDKDKFDYIKINVSNVSVVDFAMPPSKKDKMVTIGYEATMNYFKNIYPVKRKKLFKIYYEIELLLIKIREEIKNLKIKKGYLILMELMAYLCENKKFIDIAIYNKILEFKNEYKKNYKISKFLFLSEYSLEDKKEILNINNYLIKVLNIKTVELKDINTAEKITSVFKGSK